MEEFMLAIVLAFLVVGGGVMYVQAKQRSLRASIRANAPHAGITDDDTIPEARSKARAWDLASDMAALIEHVVALDDTLTTLPPTTRAEADRLLKRYHTHN